MTKNEKLLLFSGHAGIQGCFLSDMQRYLDASCTYGVSTGNASTKKSICYIVDSLVSRGIVVRRYVRHDVTNRHKFASIIPAVPSSVSTSIVTYLSSKSTRNAIYHLRLLADAYDPSVFGFEYSVNEDTKQQVFTKMANILIKLGVPRLPSRDMASYLNVTSKSMMGIRSADSTMNKKYPIKFVELDVPRSIPKKRRRLGKSQVNDNILEATDDEEENITQVLLPGEGSAEQRATGADQTADIKVERADKTTDDFPQTTDEIEDSSKSHKRPRSSCDIEIMQKEDDKAATVLGFTNKVWFVELKDKSWLELQSELSVPSRFDGADYSDDDDEDNYSSHNLACLNMQCLQNIVSFLNSPSNGDSPSSLVPAEPSGVASNDLSRHLAIHRKPAARIIQDLALHFKYPCGKAQVGKQCMYKVFPKVNTANSAAISSEIIGSTPEKEGSTEKSLSNIFVNAAGLNRDKDEPGNNILDERFIGVIHLADRVRHSGSHARSAVALDNGKTDAADSSSPPFSTIIGNNSVMAAALSTDTFKDIAPETEKSQTDVFIDDLSQTPKIPRINDNGNIVINDKASNKRRAEFTNMCSGRYVDTFKRRFAIILQILNKMGGVFSFSALLCAIREIEKSTNIPYVLDRKTLTRLIDSLIGDQLVLKIKIELPDRLTINSNGSIDIIVLCDVDEQTRNERLKKYVLNLMDVAKKLAKKRNSKSVTVPIEKVKVEKIRNRKEHNERTGKLHEAVVANKVERRRLAATRALLDDSAEADTDDEDDIEQVGEEEEEDDEADAETATNTISNTKPIFTKEDSDELLLSNIYSKEGVILDCACLQSSVDPNAVDDIDSVCLQLESQSNTRRVKFSPAEGDDNDHEPDEHAEPELGQNNLHQTVSGNINDVISRIDLNPDDEESQVAGREEALSTSQSALLLENFLADCIIRRGTTMSPKLAKLFVFAIRQNSAAFKNSVSLKLSDLYHPAYSLMHHNIFNLVTSIN